MKFHDFVDELLLQQHQQHSLFKLCPFSTFQCTVFPFVSVEFNGVIINSAVRSFDELCGAGNESNNIKKVQTKINLMT